MEMSVAAGPDDISEEVKAFLEIVLEISLQVAGQQDGIRSNIATAGNQEEEI